MEELLYFYKLYNENPVKGVRQSDTSLRNNILYCHRIKGSDVKIGLRKMISRWDLTICQLKFASVWRKGHYIDK